MKEHTPLQGRSAIAGRTDGSAVIVSFLVLVLVAGAGVALLALSHTHLDTHRSDPTARQILYMTEAGLERGRSTLARVGWDLDQSLIQVAGGNGTIDFEPDTLAGVLDDEGNVIGFTGYGDDTPLIEATRFGDGLYATFLTNDPVDGPGSTHDRNERVMLTAVGSGPDHSLSIVQATVEPERIVPDPPALITLLGPTPEFHGGVHFCAENVPGKTYDGADCSDPTLWMPTVGWVAADVDADGIDLGVSDGTVCANRYTSGRYADRHSVANLDDPTQPTVVTGNGTIDVAWKDCATVQSMLDDLRHSAAYVCPRDPCSLPSQAPAGVLFVDGDLELGPDDDGQGILVVTGRLQMDGAASWRGMLLVIGEGEFARVNPGSGSIRGAVVVGHIAGPDGVAGNADDCTGGNHGFGTAKFHEADGQSGDTTYCGRDVASANPLRGGASRHLRRR